MFVLMLMLAAAVIVVMILAAASAAAVVAAATAAAASAAAAEDDKNDDYPENAAVIATVAEHIYIPFPVPEIYLRRRHGARHSADGFLCRSCHDMQGARRVSRKSADIRKATTGGKQCRTILKR